MEETPDHAAQRAPWWREWLPRALFESFLIVLSVLAALAVNEWHDGRARDERVRVALRSVRAELESNRRAVERARAFHLETMDSLRAYQTVGHPPPRRIYYERGMFQPARSVSTAWQSAREAGVVSDVPYDLVLVLSRVYGRQARYEALADQLAGDVMADVRRRGADVVLRDGYANFITLDEDFSHRESSLADEYASALAAIDAARP